MQDFYDATLMVLKKKQHLPPGRCIPKPKI